MVEEELKQYILQRYKSIKEFASVADIPYTTLDSILKRGVGKANVLNIIRLCDALEIDTNALAQGVIAPTKKGVYQVLEEIMKEKHLNIAEVARLCGLPDSTVRGIITRKQKNTALEVAFKLSEGLNVSLERLNGMSENKKTPAPETRDGKGKNLVRTIGRDGSYDERYLTDEQLEALQAIINQMPDVEDDF